MDHARQFRKAAALANRGRQRQGWRYSAELRALALDHIRRSRAEGRTYAETSVELGISTLTLSRWLESSRSVNAASRAFRPVSVVEMAESGKADSSLALSAPVDGFAVVTPGGYRIEGLSWPHVLELARLVE